MRRMSSWCVLLYPRHNFGPAIRGSFIPIWILRVNKDFGDWKGQWTGVIWKMRERQSFALMAEGGIPRIAALFQACIKKISFLILSHVNQLKVVKAQISVPCHIANTKNNARLGIFDMEKINELHHEQRLPNAS